MATAQLLLPGRHRVIETLDGRRGRRLAKVAGQPAGVLCCGASAGEAAPQRVGRRAAASACGCGQVEGVAFVDAAGRARARDERIVAVSM